MLDKWHKKEKPVFTGIARGVGGFGFGKSAGGPSGPGFSVSGGNVDGYAAGNGWTYHTFTSSGSLVISGAAQRWVQSLVGGFNPL